MKQIFPIIVVNTISVYKRAIDLYINSRLKHYLSDFCNIPSYSGYNALVYEQFIMLERLYCILVESNRATMGLWRLQMLLLALVCVL